jgi:hypothetical protein
MTIKKLLLSALSIALIVVGLAPAQTSRPATGDFSPAQLQRLTAKAFGEILLEDRESNMIVSVKKEKGKISSVLVTWFNDLDHPTGDAVAIELAPPKAGKPQRVSYNFSRLDETAPRLLAWQDLNGDGVWDLRITSGDWPTLGIQRPKDAPGSVQAFVDGKWRQVTGSLAEDRTKATLDGAVYKFDLARGAWMSTK